MWPPGDSEEVSARFRVASCCLALTAASCAGSPGFEDFSWSALQRKISVATPTLEALPSASVPAPDGLRATSGVLRAIPLKWDPMLRSDVAGYLVERAAVRDGPFGRAARIEGRLLTAYLDHSEADGETIFYRVRSYTPEGRISVAPSDVISATTALPPVAPEHLRAYSYQPRQVPLSWQTSRDTTAAGYVVYRSPSSRGPFERMGALEGRHTTVYRDSRLESLRVFYYRVTARNIHGVEGPPSEPVRAVTKPEPLPPVGLRVVELGLGVNRLTWEPNVETDIVEYRLLLVRHLDGIRQLLDQVVPAGAQLVANVQALHRARCGAPAGGLHQPPSGAKEVRLLGAAPVRKDRCELHRVEAQGFHVDRDLH